MKLLDVGGVEYAADSFEKVFDTDEAKKDLWEKVWKEENHSLAEKIGIEEYGEKYEVNLYFTAYDFEEVDRDFVSYVRDIQDYDETKHSNFYIID